MKDTERTNVKLNPQQELLIDYMRNGSTLTNMIAANNLGVQSVSRRITELQELGFKIKKAWKKDHFGNRYMTYSLEEETEQ
jgi:phage gp16-like protein